MAIGLDTMLVRHPTASDIYRRQPKFVVNNLQRSRNAGTRFSSTCQLEYSNVIGCSALIWRMWPDDVRPLGFREMQNELADPPPN